MKKKRTGNKKRNDINVRVRLHLNRLNRVKLWLMIKRFFKFSHARDIITAFGWNTRLFLFKLRLFGKFKDTNVCVVLFLIIIYWRSIKIIQLTMCYWDVNSRVCCAIRNVTLTHYTKCIKGSVKQNVRNIRVFLYL